MRVFGGHWDHGCTVDLCVAQEQVGGGKERLLTEKIFKNIASLDLFVPSVLASMFVCMNVLCLSGQILKVGPVSTTRGCKSDHQVWQQVPGTA